MNQLTTKRVLMDYPLSSKLCLIQRLQRLSSPLARFSFTYLFSCLALIVAASAQTADENNAAPEAAPATTQQGTPAATDAQQNTQDPVATQSNEARSAVIQASERLMMALSEKIASEPVAQPAKLDKAIIDLASPKLQVTLADEEKAGNFIHKLRKSHLVPVRSIAWGAMKAIKQKSAPEEKAAQEVKATAKSPATHFLIGHVSLKDGRFGSLKVELAQDGKVVSVSRSKLEEHGGHEVADQIMARLMKSDFDTVWKSANKELRAYRKSQDQFIADVKSDEIEKTLKYEWGKSTDFEGGYRLDGTRSYKAEDGAEVTTPFYMVLLSDVEGLTLLDVQSTTSFWKRVQIGSADSLDISLLVMALALILGFLYIIFSYTKGLVGSPRELYILFFTKVTEYSAYGAAQLCFMFYLREDVGLSDIGAGTYYSVWSTSLTAITMVVGAFCDAIGIKRTLLVGSFALLFSRAVMPFSDGIVIATIFGFIPLAVGIAITGPVLSVGIKRYTTREGAALGFGLFYTLMNVGWAIGAWLFDYMRINLGDAGTSFMGHQISTYEAIIGIGFIINVPDLIAILWMRRGVERTETGVKIEVDDSAVEGMGPFDAAITICRKAIKDTIKIFSENFVQRAFWIFLALIGITVFARLTFFHFHVTWPSYGARYFGAGSLIGNIFGVLNPIMIVFLVPVIAFMTRKISSYKMLLIGTVISVASVLFVVVPIETFAWLEDTWLGTFIFDRWLEVPIGRRDPYYISMVLFVTVFTVGEAIWSPRLMQFTAEIAPPGREGSYVALAYLPYFGAKFIVGPMAGFLLSYYTPEFGIDGTYMNYPDHQSIWLWVGGTAALTPIGLVLLQRLYREAEERAKIAAEEADRQTEDAATEGAG